MATLREYFDTDLNKNMSVHNTWGIGSSESNITHEIIAKIAQAYDANAKFWSFYIEEGADVSATINALFSSNEVKQCILSPEGDGVVIQTGFSDYSEMASSETLRFTGRIFLYINEMLGKEYRKQVTEHGLALGYNVIIRDKEYALKRSEMEKPLAFISHDSRDKDPVVRKLVHELSKLQCPVWYDEYSLNVGDSLRSSIEAGLKETKKCVVILSPNFLSNEGWGKAEFDSVYTREILEKDNVILPVWHEVSVENVYEYSPRLADKVGLNSSIGIEELARKLANVIKNN
ncbi:toll/interleukin-1 receptor domain-containing protein [Pseudoalteromonas sp. OF7H-1]|uniref:toll/interleukin-1 receptor domain-containing protein n=1 Tax=Pseudoalteromonas sp. OF7H-1 TaxID=2917755 RepID=UPI001EF4CD11|nr:toll/interleukin-1 receptor domain-containing protein [Pseudoalteromonas sp. OF7H-1]MCG7539875.1 toll/interleukin-1 receptor domain-containing protein [Pseudoalteromonas sp. OF7H-1]